MKLTPFYLLICIVFFIGCDSKPQEAQEIQIVNIQDEKEILKENEYLLTTTTGEKIVFEISNGVLFSKQLNGKIVLINFWATWCKPCLNEMPSFVSLQEKYKDDFTIIGVLFEKEKDEKDLSDFMKKYHMNFPVTVGKENFRLAKSFDDVKMIPESFLYNKEGFFIEKFIGEIERSKLENYITSSIK
ncbi:TlpA disulfide reductase family protein [Arcobacteraceae bacterium]|nr:TlpA disulfide reductase family protein [Arcobacteraceae bacterium]